MNDRAGPKLEVVPKATTVGDSACEPVANTVAVATCKATRTGSESIIAKSRAQLQVHCLGPGDLGDGILAGDLATGWHGLTQQAHFSLWSPLLVCSQSPHVRVGAQQPQEPLVTMSTLSTGNKYARNIGCSLHPRWSKTLRTTKIGSYCTLLSVAVVPGLQCEWPKWPSLPLDELSRD